MLILSHKFLVSLCSLGIALQLGGCGGSSDSNSSSSTLSYSSVSSSLFFSSSSSTNNSTSHSSISSNSISSTAASHASVSSDPTDVSPQQSGLDSRPVNSSCVAPEPPVNSTGITLTRVFADLAFSNSLGLLREPGNSARWYVLEKAGRVRVFDNAATTNLRTFVDLQARVDDSSGESGLLAMAFHPNFVSNGEVFLYYSRDNGSSPRRNTLARYTSSDGGQTLDPDSEEILLSVQPPYDNHYGGQLGFDENGFLYLSLGDGGSGGDPGNRAQTTSNLFGSMLRIDVDNGSPYVIPATNPFVGNALCNNGENAVQSNCPEIVAWGLRNPWRWSFDRATGDIWLADVGQDAVEEINRIQIGGNYGWRLREGNQCYNPATNCGRADLIEPVAVIPQPSAQSITGGFVYRGENIPGLVGRYLVGDFVTGGLWALTADSAGDLAPQLLDNTGLNIASFGEDAAGELYLISLGGEIYRIDPAGSASDSFPRVLSETGCVDPSDPTQPASGLIPYRVNAPFWSDGADKQRWLALPENTGIDINASNDWVLPRGSVLMKHFYLADQLIETRLFMRHNTGDWAGYSYEWNSSGTDAYLVQGGKVVSINGQDWIYPSSADCLRCHTAAAGRTLGIETAQLNGPLTYPTTGRTANQLLTHEAIDTLNEPLSGAPDQLPRLLDPMNSAASLEARARAYLHTNCAQCHRPEGPTNVNLDLHYAAEFKAMNICNQAPQNATLGISNPMRLAPGAPERSLLLQRMKRRDLHAMPPLGTNRVDTAGVALIEEWIENINTCP